MDLVEIGEWVLIVRPRAGKKGFNHLDCDLFYTGGLPLWCVIFVNGERADTFHGFTGNTAAAKVLGVEAVVNDVALHAQVVCHAEVPSTANLFEADMEH